MVSFMLLPAKMESTPLLNVVRHFFLRISVLVTTIPKVRRKKISHRKGRKCNFSRLFPANLQKFSFPVFLRNSFLINRTISGQHIQIKDGFTNSAIG